MVDNMLVDNFLSMLRNRQKKRLLDFKYSSNIKPKYYEDDEVAIIQSLDGLSIYNDVRKIIFEIKQNDNLISLAKIEKHNISIDISEKNLDTIRETVGHTDERTTLHSYCYDRRSEDEKLRQFERAFM